jgi:hypothetical protein
MDSRFPFYMVGHLSPTGYHEIAKNYFNAIVRNKSIKLIKEFKTKVKPSRSKDKRVKRLHLNIAGKKIGLLRDITGTITNPDLSEKIVYLLYYERVDNLLVLVIDQDQKSNIVPLFNGKPMQIEKKQIFDNVFAVKLPIPIKTVKPKPYFWMKEYKISVGKQIFPLDLRLNQKHAKTYIFSSVPDNYLKLEDIKKQGPIFLNEIQIGDYELDYRDDFQTSFEPFCKIENKQLICKN